MHGKTLDKTPAVKRRPAAMIQRSTAGGASAATTPSPARALQQRMGNQATQALVSRTLPAVQAAAGTPLKSAVDGARPSPAATAQAAISTVASEKAAQIPAVLKGLMPGSRPVPETGSRVQAAQPAAAKAAAPKTEAPPAKAHAGPSGTKAPAGAKEGKAIEAQAAAPDAHTAIAPAITAVRHRAAGARKHSVPGVPVASAQAAARMPAVEHKRTDATQTVVHLDADAARTQKVNSEEFKTKLRKAIAETMKQPKTASEAKDVMEHGATNARATLQGNLAQERDAAVGPMKSALDPKMAPAPSAPAEAQASTLQPEPIGPPPAPVSAAPVVPAPLPPERLDYSSDRGPTDQVMAENNVTKEQMQESNDPAFGPTLQARSTAEKHEETAEAKYRQGESKVQDQAHAAATQSLSKDLLGMQGVRAQQIGKVVTQQQGTRTKDAQERQRITDTITGIKDKTRNDVNLILEPMEKEAGEMFETGLQQAEKAYEHTFDEAKGGAWNWLTNWGSDWEELIENSLAKARQAYLQEVDVAIDKVSAYVDEKLEAAKKRVADGRKQVEDFVNGLDASVKQFGEEALQSVSADFDAMVGDIDQRRDGLINKLTEQYKASYQRMSAMEEKLREENKSLWQRVYDATVGLIKKIIEFKNMLLSALAKAASVIGDIIAHPIRFLGNLVSGVMQGLKNFMSKIGTYLLKGIMDWLFGALAGAGLQLPDKFDLQGIISIVLQILGLTYANFRARAVAIVGEPVVAAIEKTAEVFKVIVTEGVPGLWRFIKEQLANLKSMVLDAIFDYIKDKVIMAGITWIIGLLNPASAFFKACKAIYDIIMFFVNRGKQILDLVNAVVDSVAAIAAGNIGVAASKVEAALAKAIPVAIGFLASLLGLGDPSKPVKGFIEKAQAPVNKAIDWVINLAVKAVKAVGKLVGGLLGGKKGDKEKKAEEPADKKVRWDRGVAAVQALVKKERHNPSTSGLAHGLKVIKEKFGFTELSFVVKSGKAFIDAAMSPGQQIPVDDTEFVTAEDGVTITVPLKPPAVTLGFALSNDGNKRLFGFDGKGAKIMVYVVSKKAWQTIPSDERVKEMEASARKWLSTNTSDFESLVNSEKDPSAKGFDIAGLGKEPGSSQERLFIGEAKGSFQGRPLWFQAPKFTAIHGSRLETNIERLGSESNKAPVSRIDAAIASGNVTIIVFLNKNARVSDRAWGKLERKVRKDLKEYILGSFPERAEDIKKIMANVIVTHQRI